MIIYGNLYDDVIMMIGADREIGNLCFEFLIFSQVLDGNFHNNDMIIILIYLYRLNFIP